MVEKKRKFMRQGRGSNVPRMPPLKKPKIAPHEDESHEEKALHDKKIAEKLSDEDDCLDWVVICTFYYALHCIDAHAHRHGRITFESGPDENISPHTKRSLYVWNHLKSFFFIYRKLYSKGWQSRYDPQYFKNVPEVYCKRLLEASNKFQDLLNCANGNT